MKFNTKEKLNTHNKIKEQCNDRKAALYIHLALQCVKANTEL